MMKKITKVEKQKNNDNRYSIYLDDEFAFGVHKDILIKYELLKGKEIEDDFINEVIKAKEQSKANNYALKLLSYRSKTSKEILKKMREKGYDQVTINNSVEFLEKLGYVNDRQYALNFVREKVNIKKLGRKRLEFELFKKGIDQDIVNDVISELVDTNEEYHRALEIGLKKLNSSYKNDDKQAQYRKLGGYLQRKGYNYDIVKKVLDELITS